MKEVEEAITRAHREEWARLVSGLARRFGDLDLAEEAAAEAFAVAVERWPVDGLPSNPGGWLTTTAQRRALDRLRRESRRDAKLQEAQMLHDDGPAAEVGVIGDDRLRLVFICCHPALAMPARVALTLRMVGGLSVSEISRAFLVSESTIARRITRAKAKIAAAAIPYRVPVAADLRPRIDGVLAVLFLIFNEGYLSAEAERHQLAREAIRLTRLCHALLPGEGDGEVSGLLALMLFTEARRPARVAEGELVTIDEQDRQLWDAGLIAEGRRLVRERLAAVAAGQGRPGRFQILAAINAVHTWASCAEDTDWQQVLALHDQLASIDPSPVVALNRAVAVAEVRGPAEALALVEELDLADYQPFHATRADLLRRLGRTAESTEAYSRALELTTDPAQAATLRSRRAATREMG